MSSEGFRLVPDEEACVELILETLWSMRAFRESFLDTHKNSIVRRTRRSRDEKVDKDFWSQAIKVNHVLAAVFHNVDCRRTSPGLNLASAALSATSSFSFLRFLVSGFVAWTLGETKGMYGEQCRVYLRFKDDADRTNNGELTLKYLTKVLKRHLKWLEQAAYSDKDLSESINVSRGLLAHLSEFNLIVECAEWKGLDEEKPDSLVVAITDILSCKWRCLTCEETPAWKESSLGRFLERRGGSAACTNSRLSYCRKNARHHIDLILPDSHASQTSAGSNTDGLNSLAGHDFCGFDDESSGIPCLVSIARGFQELICPGAAASYPDAKEMHETSKQLPSRGKDFYMVPLMDMFPRSYASIDVRDIAAGLFFDIMRLLQKQSSAKIRGNDEKQKVSILKTTDTACHFIEEESNSTYPLNSASINVFRQQVRADWPVRIEPRQKPGRNSIYRNGFLPENCFRFWHPVDVESFVGFCEQSILGVEMGDILKGFLRDKGSAGCRVKADETENYESDTEKIKLAKVDGSTDAMAQSHIVDGYTNSGGLSLGENYNADNQGETDTDVKVIENEIQNHVNDDSGPIQLCGEITLKLSTRNASANKEEDSKTESTLKTQKKPSPSKDQSFACLQSRYPPSRKLSEQQHAELSEEVPISGQTSQALALHGAHAQINCDKDETDYSSRENLTVSVPDFAQILKTLMRVQVFKSIDYECAQSLLQNEAINFSELYPTLRMFTRPSVFCVRLLWPSKRAIRSPRLSKQALQLVWDTLEKTDGILDLYDVYSVIGGKMRDIRDKDNILACKFSLRHVICFPGQSATCSHKFERNNGLWSSKGSSVNADLDWQGVKNLCCEQGIFPELLFFESIGPTSRDVRQRERLQRVESSKHMPNLNDLGDVLRNSKCEDEAPSAPLIRPTVHSYGTIASETTKGQERYSQEMDPQWCNGPCCVS